MLFSSILSVSSRLKSTQHFPLFHFSYLISYPFNSRPSSCIPHQDSLMGSYHELPTIHHFSHNTLFFHLRSVSNLPVARKLHALLVVHGYLHQNHSLVLGAQLVHIYVSLNSLQEALLVFNHLPKRNSFAWNSIIKGLVDTDNFTKALDFYHSMIREGSAADNFTFPLVLKACSGLSDLQQGRKIHESIESVRVRSNAKPNIFVQCALIHMFAKCGSLGEARMIFENMPTRDLATWGAMISGMMQEGTWFEALNLFRRMRMEGFMVDSVIVATVIPACGRIRNLQIGMGLHGCAIKFGLDDDLYVSNALIDMYCKCGHTEMAECLFRSIEFKDVISWSSLLAGYSQNCAYTECLALFSEMMGLGLRPTSVTLASVLPSFSVLKLFKQGKEIHNYAIRQGFELDVFIASALIDFYCKCRLTREAEIIFDIMADRDIAIGNSLVAGYASNGDVDSAFQTLRRLQKGGFRLSSITIVSVIPLCNRFTMLNKGKELHAYVTRSSLGSVVAVNNSLIDMYCKCGCLDLAKKVFDLMTERDVVTYNIIIAAFGMHGYGDQAIMFFDHMKEQRIEPDKVTFIALLSACSHAGLIESGFSFYNSMLQDYGISPEMEHYSCMVDLYSRSGSLEDAWSFVGKIVEPNIDVLGSLLGACRVHKRVDIAELVSKRIFERRPEDPGYYILLSNIYADAGRWVDVMKVRAMIQEQSLKKKAGNSWT
ncbi:putative pentatricopeptide repeat-containing protein At3g01580 [Typha angustifolia]|uniref:putative pentatricopeptide repeat-containing protein At3g01580 n=1 Tax=Typha angustifolia TaxID=59011 RepID=UPI003C2CBF20